MGSQISVKSVMWKHQANKDGAYPVRIRITKNRQSKYKTIPRLVVKEKEWKVMEPILDKLIGHLKDINEAMSEVQDERERHDFFEYAEKWVERYNNEKNMSFYRSSQSLIEKFRAFTGPGPKYFHEIDHSLILDYQAWLKQRKTKEGRIINGPNTRTYSIKRLRIIYRAAIKERLVSPTLWPFDNIKMERNESIKKALTIEQLNAIRKLKLEKGSDLWHYRNMFLFCFNAMGMRIGDCLRMKHEHVEDGKIVYEMGKSGDIINIAQTKEAEKILSYYTKNRDSEYVFPVLSTDKTRTLFNRISHAEMEVNQGLKVIAREAKIKIKLSTHIARHTWAELALKAGVNIKMIQRALGHESVDTTQKYTKDFASEVVDEMNKMVTSL